MALYHLTTKTGTRATGASALAKAQYIQREDRYARVPDALVHTLSRNLPDFARGSAAAYWDAADVYERANGRLFKEVEFALPVELPAHEQRALAERFAEELTAGESLPYTLAIHAGKGTNPHCHVLLSERVNDGIARPAAQWFRRWNAREPEQGGARKSRALHPRAWLETIRERWAELVNRALERLGIAARVDHRSLESQGVERVPQLHLGPRVLRMENRGLRTERGDQSLRIARSNDDIANHRQELRELDQARERQGSSSRSNLDASAGRTAEREETDPDSATRESRSPNRGGDRQRSPSLASTNPPLEAAPTSRDAASNRRDRSRPRQSRSRSISLASGPSRGPSDRTGTEREAKAPESPEPPRARRTPTPSPSTSGEALERSRGRSTSPGRRGPRRSPAERTERAVSRQLTALGCAVFEVGIREQASGRMLNRTWSRDEVLKRLPWLRRMNAIGNDIFVRPAREGPGRGLVLVDDLDRWALAELRRDGLAPAAIVETSPRNYQAWIRVPERARDPERREISRGLAREYGGDPASAGAHHYGRLAGFTNRKPVHPDELGLQPFALLRGASGRSAPAGERLLEETRRELRRRERERQREAARRRASSREKPRRSDTPEAQREALELFRVHMRRLNERLADPSRRDFVAALGLAAKGFAPATIRQTLREASPDLEQRKRGHVEDYLRRTVEAAMRVDERSRERDRGRERDPMER